MPYNDISGVRVYMEGFRVLPYGDSGDDWLRIDEDVTRRSRGALFADLEKLGLPGGALVGQGALAAIPQRQYAGAIFLREAQAEGLRILVNREGFIPDASFYAMQDIVRAAILLNIRVRSGIVARRREQRRGNGESDSHGSETQSPLTYGEIRESSAAIKRDLLASSKPGTALASEVAKRASFTISSLLEVADLLANRVQQLYVLASVGTVTASIVHELLTILGVAKTLEIQLLEIRRRTSSDLRPQIARAMTTAEELRRMIERQAGSLVDVVGADARRRRSRQHIARRFETARAIVRSAIEERRVTVINRVSEDLQTSPMFAAELMSVLTNLLTNAVKNAGAKGTVRARGGIGNDGRSFLVIENTGRKVDLGSSEHLFEPYESTTSRIDPILGQGMGLGLTITRRILEQSGAKIRFVSPGKAFSTAVRIDFA